MSIVDTWIFWGHKSIIDLRKYFEQVRQRSARELSERGNSVSWLMTIVYDDIKVTKSQSETKQLKWLLTGLINYVQKPSEIGLYYCNMPDNSYGSPDHIGKNQHIPLSLVVKHRIHSETSCSIVASRRRLCKGISNHFISWGLNYLK